MSLLTSQQLKYILKILSVDILSCSHERCADYFMESIQSAVGFYGWKCENYFKYVFGLCPFEDSDMMEAGENCKNTTRGMFLVKTNSKYPFAKGRNNDDYGNDVRTKRFNDHSKALRDYLRNYSSDFESDSKNTYKFFSKDDFHKKRLLPRVTLVNKYFSP